MLCSHIVGAGSPYWHSAALQHIYIMYEYPHLVMCVFPYFLDYDYDDTASVFCEISSFSPQPDPNTFYSFPGEREAPRLPRSFCCGWVAPRLPRSYIDPKNGRAPYQSKRKNLQQW